MNRQQFETKKSQSWLEFDTRIQAAAKRKPIEDGATVPSRFRKICYDLSLAQYRMFGPRLCDRLNSLAIQGYRTIHRKKGVFGEGVLKFVLFTFPQTFRREWKLFLVASAVFWIPFFLMWWSAGHDIAWIQAILGADGMAGLEAMYGKGSDPVEHERQKHGSNFQMFAHYIQNNVGIDFKLFAGGLIFGVGALFILIMNGLAIGATFGYVGYAGDPEKLWRFVAGHSSFELLGMIVVGMAGLKMGFALLAPGQLTRAEALTKAGRDGLPLLIGGSGMTALAAVVEGFWSAQRIDANIKYFVGIAFWLLHILYFTFTGRRRLGT